MKLHTGIIAIRAVLVTRVSDTLKNSQLQFGACAVTSTHTLCSIAVYNTVGSWSARTHLQQLQANNDIMKVVEVLQTRVHNARIHSLTSLQSKPLLPQAVSRFRLCILQSIPWEPSPQSQQVKRLTLGRVLSVSRLFMQAVGHIGGVPWPLQSSTLLQTFSCKWTSSRYCGHLEIMWWHIRGPTVV